jgi:hypothetical protein
MAAVVGAVIWWTVHTARLALHVRIAELESEEDEETEPASASVVR